MRKGIDGIVIEQCVTALKCFNLKTNRQSSCARTGTRTAWASHMHSFKCFAFQHMFALRDLSACQWKRCMACFPELGAGAKNLSFHEINRAKHLLRFISLKRRQKKTDELNKRHIITITRGKPHQIMTKNYVLQPCDRWRAKSFQLPR